MVGLELAREELYQRIDLRVDDMVSRGLLDEVNALSAFKNLNALNTVGYREVFEYLDGKVSLENAITLVKRNTRHYAKRQLTWFKRDETTCWFHPDNLHGVLEHCTRSVGN
jgi:tRNA dimethylallyltransferase